MTYEEAVKYKKQMMGETVITPTVESDSVELPVSQETSPVADHEFKQSFLVQNDYKIMPVYYFGWVVNRKVLVGQTAIPRGLCEICNKLEVEHNICQ